MNKKFDRFMERKSSRDKYIIFYGLKSQFKKKIFRIFFVVIFTIAFVSFVFSFLIFPICQNSNSMSPSVKINSFIFATPIKTNLNRGDVVLIDKEKKDLSIFQLAIDKVIKFFTFQKNGLNSKNDQLSSKNSLRRIVGIPGDTIYMKDYVVYIKPQDEKYFLTEFELIKKKYDVDISNLPNSWDNNIGFKSDFTPVILGTNQYFVLADNRFSSLDSRHWGALQKSEIVAKALALYLPIKSAKLF